MKAKSKSELAAAAGVSLETMRKYINSVIPGNPLFEKYNRRCRLLNPKQAAFICEQYAIDIK